MKLTWILVIALAGATAGLVFTRLEGDAPLIQGRTTEAYVGDRHARDFRIVDHGMGLRRVRVWEAPGCSATYSE